MAKIILSPQFSRQIINLSLHEISELFTESVLIVIKSQNKHEQIENSEVYFRSFPFYDCDSQQLT